mmetsp:Transcript_896/g.3401  ORF Transcript_896/g.3401 Transcript_896/m.3401 type:complete len:204 (+) Transcript_896:1062-1673(+)
MQTLYPSSADCTRCEISSNTSPCPQSCPNTRSKLKSKALAPPGGAISILRPAISPAASTFSSGWSMFLPPPVLSALGSSSFAGGRTRQNTRMFPFSSCTALCSARLTMAACRNSASRCARSLSSSCSLASLFLAVSSRSLRRVVAVEDSATASLSLALAAASASLCSSCFCLSTSSRFCNASASEAAACASTRRAFSSSAVFL